MVHEDSACGLERLPPERPARYVVAARRRGFPSVLWAIVAMPKFAPCATIATSSSAYGFSVPGRCELIGEAAPGVDLHPWLVRL